MKKTVFEEAVSKAKRGLKELENDLAAVQQQIETGNVKEAYELSLKAEDSSERLTLLMRALPAYTGKPNANTDSLEATRINIKVDIGYTVNGWFVLRMPILLPKKSEGSASYIRAFLYPAMKEYFEGKAPFRYSDCVLVFRHVYDQLRPEREYRDHDNIELNMVADVLAMYVMEDDAPLKCRHYYCSAAGSEERTEVYVVPREGFSEFLILEDRLPESGVELYESYLYPRKKHVPNCL